MKNCMKKAGIVLFTLLCVLMLVPGSAQAAKLSRKAKTLYVGQTFTLQMKGTKSKVKWTTSKKKVAKVKSIGKVKARVTAVKAGKAIIKAKVNGKVYKSTITVKSSFKSVTPSVDVYDNATIYINMNKSSNIYYTVANPGMLTCSWNGSWNGKNGSLNVVGNQMGSTYITVVNSDTGECKMIKVNVKRAKENLADIYVLDKKLGSSCYIKTDNYLVDNYGNQYTHSYYAGGGSVTFLTNYKYSNFSGTVATPKEIYSDSYRTSATLTIYGDGNQLAVFREVNNLVAPKKFNIDISSYERVTLEWDCEGGNIWDNWGHFATIFDGTMIRYAE